MPNHCDRCQRKPDEIPDDPDGSKLWFVTWTTEGNPKEILCGECLDQRDEYLAQQTGHHVNYDAPEAVHPCKTCPGYHDLGCDMPITNDGFCHDCNLVKNGAAADYCENCDRLEISCTCNK